MMQEKITSYQDQNIPFVSIYASYDVAFRSFDGNTANTGFPDESHLHVSNQIHIYYIIEGYGTLQIENKYSPIKAGEFVIVHGWQPHCFQPQSKPCKYCIIQFELNILETIKTIPHLNTDLVSLISNTGKTQEAFFTLDEKHTQRFNELLKKYNHHKGFCMDILRFSTFLELIVFCCVQVKKLSNTNTGKSKNKNISKNAIEYIDMHYLEDIKLEDIANHLFISKKYLNTAFKKETGFTIKNYIIHRRIIQSKVMLRNPKITVNEAFSSSGFSDYSNFFKHFKKIVNMTPKEYQDSFQSQQLTMYNPEYLQKIKAEFPDDE